MVKAKIPSCGHCGKNAEIELEYTRQNLCSSCFSKVFEKRVRKANHKFQMFKRGDLVVVGVSGGKDSGALLYILSKMAGEIGFEVKPVLVDEGIHGYRNKALKEAEKLCEKRGLELEIFSYKKLFGKTMDEVMKARDEGKVKGKACSFCGVFRKKALNQAALELKATKVAIGHNADDVAQTFLMNLLRAEGERNERFRIVDKPKKGFVPRVRPLVFNTEKETALFCLTNDIPFHLGECPYSSEAFRAEVKGFLNETEEKYPGVKFNLLHSFLQNQEWLDEKTGKSGEEKEMRYCEECSSPSSGRKCKACELKEKLGS
ncbi:MAG TPA: TIGR00269 family protein [Candidatus Norongarragalinales archaeon]|nr:TIGR00269 family protein [Candidatus Norongarragalinales archaeon]